MYSHLIFTTFNLSISDMDFNFASRKNAVNVKTMIKQLREHQISVYASFFPIQFFRICSKHLAATLNVLTRSCYWKSKRNKHASVLSRHLVQVSFWGRIESEWTPCGVARRRVRLSKARWSYLPTDDSCIVLSDSSVWKVLWIQSQMPLLLWYSCLDTKSTWTSIWSQHDTLHVRQPLSQNSLFLPLSLPPCFSLNLSTYWYLTFCVQLKVTFLW